MAEMRRRIDRLIPAAIVLAAISTVFWLALIWGPSGISGLTSEIRATAVASGILAGVAAYAVVASQMRLGLPHSVGTVAAAICGLSALVASVLLWVGDLGIDRQLHLNDGFFAVPAILIPAAVIVTSLPLQHPGYRLAICLGSVAVFWSPVIMAGHGMGVALAFRVLSEHFVSGYRPCGLTATCILTTWFIMFIIGRRAMNRRDPDSSHSTNDRIWTPPR